jgi:hypothetical protein
MHPPPAGDASKGIKIRREEEKNIGDSQSNTTSSAAKREGGKEREQTDLERMVIETEEKEFAVIKKSFEREEKKEIIGDENKCDKIKEKAIAFGDAFMRIYPRSDGERGARIVIEQMWRNGIINRNNWEDILDAVKQQKNGHDLSRPWKFIPLAKNWLRDNRWLDEIRPARLAKKSKKKHMVGEYDPELDGSTKIGW